MEFNKLVRDDMIDIIESEGKKAIFHIAKGQEYEDALVRKLHEEVEEFLDKPSAEEMADILESLLAICNLKGVDLKNLDEVRRKKAEERGRFEKGIILERIE